MTKLARTGDWLSSMLGDERVMMSVETGNYVSISRVGSRVWELIETPMTFDALCEKLVGEYEVTAEVCVADITPFIDEMRNLGAIADVA